jgi:hypothetical protein
LGLKMKALRNIEKEGIETTLSMTIYPNVNDKEIMDIFIFALERSHFLDCLRLRSCYKIGRNSGVNEEGYFGSEILDLFSKAINIDKRRLLAENLIDDDHSPYHVFLSMEGYVRDGRYISASNMPKKDLKQRLFSLIRKDPPKKSLLVRFINWPTIQSIDLQELENGVGQVTKDGKTVNFCHSIILDNIN